MIVHWAQRTTPGWWWVVCERETRQWSVAPAGSCITCLMCLECEAEHGAAMVRFPIEYDLIVEP